MYDRSIPTGSPLSPAGFAPDREPTMNVDPIFARQDPFRDLGSPSATALPTSGLSALPPAPPRKRPSIWDKEHISETLADIGAGFFASQNFGDGLGHAAQTIAGRTRQLREDQRPDISYGGPNDQFEISTDRRTGERTIREVPEFRMANERALEAKNRPDAKDTADLRGRALYAIATQIPPERRAEAYRNLMANPAAFGVDTTGMPAEWDDTYGTLAGTMGLTVNQALSQERDNQLAKDTMRHRQVQEGQGAERVQQGAARVAQGAARVAQGAQRVAQAGAKLRTPPSSIRKGYARVGSKAEYDALPRGSKYIAPDGSQRIKG